MSAERRIDYASSKRKKTFLIEKSTESNHSSTVSSRITASAAAERGSAERDRSDPYFVFYIGERFVARSCLEQQSRTEESASPSLGESDPPIK